MSDKKTLKNLLVHSMSKTIIIIGICVVIIATLNQILFAQSTARKEARERVDQIEHILNENADDLSQVEEDMDNEDFTTARIVAFMIGHHPDILKSDERFREIAELVGVDEIWIFDETGTIVAGTDSDTFGFNFDSGEQIAFFKPMLSDKSLKLSQDVVERSLDNKPFKYSAIWNDEGTYIVQVGKSAESTIRVTNKYNLSYIFSLLKVDSSSEFYAINVHTGIIVGSTIDGDVGHSIEEFGWDVETIRQRGSGFHARVIDKNAYCVFEERGSNLIGRIVYSKDLYKDIPMKILELSIIILLFAIVASLVLTKQVDNLVIRNIHITNEKLETIADGNYDQKIEFKNSLEFFMLSNYVNRMIAKLKEKAEYRDMIFGIVSQHSSRVLYSYDLETRTTRPWDEESEKKDILAHLYAHSYSEDTLADNQYVLPESREEVKKFFDNIHSGVPYGELNIHIKLLDGELKWYHFKYSSIFEGGRPVTAVISIEDITEIHEHYLAHLQNIQSFGKDGDSYLLYVESDLIEDRIDSIKGRLITKEDMGRTYTHKQLGNMLVNEKFSIHDFGKSAHYFDCTGLLKLYEQGERQAEGDMEVEFPDGSIHWLRTSVTLVSDPLSGNVKAFTRISDVTEESEMQRSLVQRADYDGMTGLLRRDVGEKRICEYLSEHKEPGGVLVVIDLDELKTINDTLGHSKGDAAIIGIAKTMQEHFRDNDVLVRIGGDEFVAFLPGAGKSRDAVEKSLEKLLRKLSAISVGDNGERTIHCSIGCAVELPRTDTFASLYQRADMALYHVKRNGKNNFAFFEPEMLEDNYRFKKKQSVSVVDTLVQENELKYLLEIVATKYPGIIKFNLTQNYFHVIAVGNNVEKVPKPDKIDVFWENWKGRIHPQDLEGTLAAMSRDALMEMYVQGKHSTRHYYRNLETVGYVNTEVTVRFYTTEDGDICAFLFFRWEQAGDGGVI